MKFLNMIDGADKVKQDSNNRFVSDVEKAKWNNAVEHIEDNIRHITEAERDKWNTVENKVDKVAGKGLSTNDYTDEEKQKNQDNADNISNLQQELETHKAEIATQDGYGHIRLKDIPTPTKESIGLGNVDNVKQMPISGGTFTGIAKAYSNTSYTVAQIRNIILSTSNANVSAMQDGDIWIKYK